MARNTRLSGEPTTPTLTNAEASDETGSTSGLITGAALDAAIRDTNAEILAATGGLMVRDPNGAAVALPAPGADGDYVLRWAGGVPSYAAASGGGGGVQWSTVAIIDGAGSMSGIGYATNGTVYVDARYLSFQGGNGTYCFWDGVGQGSVVQYSDSPVLKPAPPVARQVLRLSFSKTDGSYSRFFGMGTRGSSQVGNVSLIEDGASGWGVVSYVSFARLGFEAFQAVSGGAWSPSANTVYEFVLTSDHIAGTAQCSVFNAATGAHLAYTSTIPLPATTGTWSTVNVGFGVYHWSAVSAYSTVYVHPGTCLQIQMPSEA